MAGKSESQPKEIDYVSQDKRWRNHIEHETDAQRSWNARWGMLTENFEEIAKHGIRVKKPVERPVNVEVGPSPQPIPQTTARDIGWRSSVPSLALERFGNFHDKPLSILRQLKWPTEACP